MKHFFALLVCAAQCWAADTNTITFTNKSGVVITDAPVTKVLPDGILYRLPSGGGKVMFTNLPTEVQVRYGFDAADWAKRQEALQLVAGEQAARRKEILAELEKERSCFVVSGVIVSGKQTEEISGKPSDFRKGGFTFDIHRNVYARPQGDALSRIGAFVGGTSRDGPVKIGTKYVNSVFVHCDGDDLKSFRTGKEYVLRGVKRPDPITLSGEAYDQYDFATPYVSELLTRLRSAPK